MASRRRACTSPCAHRHSDKVDQAAATVKAKHGVRTLGITADVTNPSDIFAFASAVEQEFGGCDILINNAGEGSSETLMEASDQRWQDFLDLLLMSAVRMSRELVPSMKRRGGGVILNNASICALQPLFHGPIYAVAKAAMVMYSKCLAHELIKDNIRVNTINPGLIQTAGWDRNARQLGPQQGLTPRNTSTASPRITRRSAASRLPKNSPTSSCSSAPTKPGTAWAPPTTSTVAGSA